MKNVGIVQIKEDHIERASIGLPSGWLDLWLLKPECNDENGYTYDGKKNALVPKAYRSRLDRVLHWPGSKMVATDEGAKDTLRSTYALSMIETEPIPGHTAEYGKKTVPLYPSDHFALSFITPSAEEDDVHNSKGMKRKQMDKENPKQDNE